MTQDDNNIAEQAIETAVDQASLKPDQAFKADLSDYSGKIDEIEKELANESATLQKEVRILYFNALDFVKHPGHYAELGGSLAEGMAGERLGEKNRLRTGNRVRTRVHGDWRCPI